MKTTIFVTLLASFSVIAGCAVRKPWVLAQGQHPQSFQRTVTVEALATRAHLSGDGPTLMEGA